MIDSRCRSKPRPLTLLAGVGESHESIPLRLTFRWRGAAASEVKVGLFRVGPSDLSTLTTPSRG